MELLHNMKKLLTTILLGSVAVGGAIDASTLSLAEIKAETPEDYKALQMGITFSYSERTKADLPSYIITESIAGRRPVTNMAKEEEYIRACYDALKSLGVDVETLLVKQDVVCEKEVRVRGKERGLEVKRLQK